MRQCGEQSRSPHPLCAVNGHCCTGLSAVCVHLTDAKQ